MSQTRFINNMPHKTVIYNITQNSIYYFTQQDILQIQKCGEQVFDVNTLQEFTLNDKQKYNLYIQLQKFQSCKIVSKNILQMDINNEELHINQQNFDQLFNIVNFDKIFIYLSQDGQNSLILPNYFYTDIQLNTPKQFQLFNSKYYNMFGDQLKFYDNKYNTVEMKNYREQQQYYDLKDQIKQCEIKKQLVLNCVLYVVSVQFPQNGLQICKVYDSNKSIYQLYNYYKDINTDNFNNTNNLLFPDQIILFQKLKYVFVNQKIKKLTNNQPFIQLQTNRGQKLNLSELQKFGMGYDQLQQFFVLNSKVQNILESFYSLFNKEILQIGVIKTVINQGNSNNTIRIYKFNSNNSFQLTIELSSLIQLMKFENYILLQKVETPTSNQPSQFIIVKESQAQLFMINIQEKKQQQQKIKYNDKADLLLQNHFSVDHGLIREGSFIINSNQNIQLLVLRINFKITYTVYNVEQIIQHQLYQQLLKTAQNKVILLQQQRYQCILKLSKIMDLFVFLPKYSDTYYICDIFVNQLIDSIPDIQNSYIITLQQQLALVSRNIVSQIIIMKMLKYQVTNINNTYKDQLCIRNLDIKAAELRPGVICLLELCNQLLN